MAVTYTKTVFLRGISLVFMFAFASLYVQIPGLYGPRGILPAHLELQCPKGQTLLECAKQKPTLLWFSHHLGLDVCSAMEVLALAGTLMGLVGCVWVSLCTSWLVLMMWVAYFSLVTVGSTFMHFQWDILLLEAGFLALLVAPIRPGLADRASGKDDLSMWMVRWLLFRLMFASGVVKLLSNCPTWWGLTALNWHYESQCIPTPLAWFAHQFPSWFQQLSVAATFMIEIPIPLLFFSPVRNLRLFAFYCQNLLQVAIMMTGNYNFFNLLTVVLCVSLLDDEWFFGKSPRKRIGDGWAKWTVKGLVAGFVYVTLYLCAVEGFSLSLDAGVPRSKIAFTPSQFRRALQVAVPLVVSASAVLVGVELLRGMYRSTRHVDSLLNFACIAVVSGLLFTASLVPFTTFEPTTNANLPPVVKSAYRFVDRWNLVNSYGLFRSMTGVGGRPEIVMEVADSLENPAWKEVLFRYKPGALDEPPPFVAPHQPRLDWQMWFAALSRAEHNPWLYGFIYRLLEGSPEVRALLAPQSAVQKPPKQIRIASYRYHYTMLQSPNRNDSVNWWKRDSRKEYLKPVTKESPEMAMIARIGKSPDTRSVNPYWESVLKPLRSFVNGFPPHMVLWSLLIAVLCLLLSPVSN